VVFASDSVASLNSYGYSPYPLSNYIEWVRELVNSSPKSKKGFIISVTAHDPSELRTMVQSIQKLRRSINDADLTNENSRIAIELNTSCPNIRDAPPPSYNFPSLVPYLTVLANEYELDPTLTIGLKLPPYVYSTQFDDVLTGLSSFSSSGGNPFAFLTCTNTLGSSLFFSEQTNSDNVSGASTPFALPTPLGGLAGEPIHALALGNVFTFTTRLSMHPDKCLHDLTVIGVGGVTSREAVGRMRGVGAKVVGCATLLGRMGVTAFEKISGTD
jgi:dihydroorotate dehydrogenase (fumarate)